MNSGYRATLIATVALLLVALDVTAGSARQTRARRPRPTLSVPKETRLLVIAPHPDDEVLGAGGLMQRVHALGGTIRVVYFTDGDGYPEGVQIEDHVETPTASDYRGYGRQRRREARAALTALKLGDSVSRTFLSFPDGGLCQLTRSYWSERKRAYRSPYTKLDRPPRADVLVPDTEYRGEDLSQELTRIIAEFRPTLILVPRKEDQHADHCAAWFFTKDALGDVQRVEPDYKPDLVNYIIHFNSWPFTDEEKQLEAPPGLRGGQSGWMRFPITKDELRIKRAALQEYKSQVHVMDWFLDGFARTNEVFSRPAPVTIVLPTRRSPCCDR